MNNFEFSKTDTNICKGIAILFMVLHHAVAKYYNHIDFSWYAANSVNGPYMIMLFFSTAGKVCVSLLTILSGYGLAKSYSKFGENSFVGDIKYILLRYIKLYSIYLPVALTVTIVVVLRTVLSGEQIHCIQALEYALKNISMIYRSSVGDWYLKAILVLYLIFPLLHRLLKKFGVFIIILATIPWILRLGFGIKAIKIDSFLFYILSFAVGIYFEQKDVFAKFKIVGPVKSIVVPTVCLIAAFVLRLLFSLSMDIFFALSIILFEINVLSKLKSAVVLSFFGKNSANIWLFHSTVLAFFVSIRPVYKFVFALLLSLLASMFIEYIKKISKYNNLVSTVCRYIK